jgi:hypothetical protein
MGWQFRATSVCGRRDVGNTKYTYQGDSGLSVLDMESDLAIVYNSGKENFFSTLRKVFAEPYTFTCESGS